MRSLRKIGADLYRRRVLFPLLIPLCPSPLGAPGEEKKKQKSKLKTNVALAPSTRLPSILVGLAATHTFTASTDDLNRLTDHA